MPYLIPTILGLPNIFACDWKKKFLTKRPQHILKIIETVLPVLIYN